MQPSGTSPEKRTEHIGATEQKNLVVAQPDKFLGLLETISLMDKVSERLGEDRSGDRGSSGTTAGGQSQTQSQTSSRAEAIANLPDSPAMRKELSKYIQKEIKTLRRAVRRKAFRASRPGSANQMNDLYAKIRRLNSLLSELLEASVDVLKRIFIRVFVDKQSI